MSLVRYEPINLLNRIRNQINHLHGDEFLPSMFDEESSIVTSRWTPSVDVKEDDDHYIFLADIPGVDPKEIDVTCENGILTIKGERKTETEEEKEGYKRIERSSGSFYRRFNLPDTADTDSIKANSKNGVLELTIPKTDKLKPRKIEVKS